MFISSLTIEITRRCNLSCRHCLRGNSQDIDIDPMYIGILFQKISGVYSLSITGGEPILNISAIRDIVSFAKLYNVEINNFYISSNCIFDSDITFNNFIAAIIELYNYCKENVYSQLHYSNDKFHTRKPNQKYLDKLMDIPFFYNDTSLASEDLINMGRYRDGLVQENEKDIIIEKNSIRGNIYFNALGQVINGVNWSYSEQSKHIINVI